MKKEIGSGSRENWQNDVFEYADQAIMVINRKVPYSVLDVNSRFLEWYRCRKNDILNKPVPFQSVVNFLERHSDSHRKNNHAYFSIPVENNRKTEITLKATFRDIPEDGILIVYMQEIDHTPQELDALISRKDFLIREIHCRIKNNMQIISSLLHLQGLTSGNREFMNMMLANETRINLIAKIHELLYESEDQQQIDLRRYFRILVQLLSETYKAEQNGIELQFDVDPVPINVDQAIPLGLLANELISNAMKYAYDEQPGILELQAHTSDDGYLHIRIKDRGIGLPDFIDPEQPLSLGLQLVHSLSGQLEGNLFFSRNNGTEVNFRMPYSSHYH